MFNKKKKFFKQKIEAVQKTIWDLEFKVAKSGQVREGIRQDRDRAKEHLNILEARLKNKLEKEEKAKLEAEKTKFEDDVKRYEAQMQMIDAEINGVKAEGSNPGQAGILDTLASLAELKQMYHQHIKTL